MILEKHNLFTFLKFNSWETNITKFNASISMQLYIRFYLLSFSYNIQSEFVAL